MATSAKALFRALKRQDKPQEVRRAEDFYPTGQPEEDRGRLGMTPEQVAIIDLLDRVIALEATVSALSRVEAGNDR